MGPRSASDLDELAELPTAQVSFELRHDHPDVYFLVPKFLPLRSKISAARSTNRFPIQFFNIDRMKKASHLLKTRIFYLIGLNLCSTTTHHLANSSV